MRRLLGNVAGLLVALHFPLGLSADGPFGLLVPALLLAVVDGAVRPLLLFATLPLTPLAFAALAVVVDALLLEVASLLSRAVRVADFAAALAGALVVDVVGTLVALALLVLTQVAADVL